MLFLKGTLLVSLQRAILITYEIIKHEAQHRLNKVTLNYQKHIAVNFTFNFATKTSAQYQYNLNIQDIFIKFYIP